MRAKGGYLFEGRSWQLGLCFCLLFLPRLVFAAETQPCPQIQRATNEKAEITFYVRGAVPVTSLGFVYRRVAECWPDALKPKGLLTSRSRIFDDARHLGSWPDVESPNASGPFDDAVALLTQYCQGVVCGTPPRDAAAGGIQVYYLPTTSAKKVLITVTEMVKNPGSKTLNNICANYGLAKACLSSDDVKNVFAENHALRGRYVTLPNAYRVDLPLIFSVSEGEAAVIGNDILAAIARGYGLLNPKAPVDPKTLSTYSVRGHQTGVPQTAADPPVPLPPPVEPFRNRINWDAATTNKVPMAIVEPSFNKSDPGSLLDLPHPYFDSANASDNGLRFFSSQPDSARDVGHAYHVAGIIGGQRSAFGWTGLAPDADPVIFSTAGYDNWANDNLSQGDDYPRAINFSLALTPMGCRPPEIAKGLFTRIQARVMSDSTETSASRNGNPTRQPGTPLYVFAAQETNGGGCPPGSPSLSPGELRGCDDLACLGQLPAAITVLPLDGDKPRLDAIADDGNLALAAPGTDVLSADIDPVTGEKGFRARSGSSQAAPVVTAIATELAARYSAALQNGADLKARLYATAQPFPEDATPMPGCTQKAVGIVDMTRALESDPDTDVVWYRNRAEPLKGKVLYFTDLNKATPDISAIPLNDGLSPCGGGQVPQGRLLAIKRIRANPGQEIPLKFRSVFVPDDGSSGQAKRIQLSAPYTIDYPGIGHYKNYHCAPSPALTAAGMKPCLQILQGGKSTILDIEQIDLIVFAKKGQFN